MTPTDAPAAVRALRRAGLRVTRPRVAVLDVLARQPHARTDEVLAGVRRDRPVSTQAVYDVLAALTDHGVVRRIQPAGSVPRYELRTGDNHHHVVCRSCGTVGDVDCATGTAPCLDPQDLHLHAPGFALDEAEVTYWGVCAACRATQTGRDGEPASASTSPDPASTPASTTTDQTGPRDKGVPA